MMSAWTKLRSKLRAFRAAQAGNVAITFALASIPIIAFAGAAVDYSRANSVKAAMQGALDSTALMLSKEASTDTSTQLQTNASNYFKALFTRTEATNVQVTATYNPSSATAMILNATASVPTYLLGIIGINKIDLNLSATSKWGETRLRVALVLDNTGSMAQSGKMTALQSATKSLLTQLKNAVSNPGDVYVSIIPFVKDVNFDPANYNSDWIYWGTAGTQDAASPNETDNTSWDANNGTCSVGSYSTRSSCRQHGSCSISGYNSQNNCTSAGTCSNPGITSKNTCTGTKACTNASYTSSGSCTSHGYVWGYGTWSTGVWTTATWTPNNHNTWNGCVMDRGYPASPSYLTVSGSNKSGPDTTNNYDTNVLQPDPTISASLYAAEQYSPCPQAMMPLSYDWTTMNALVDAMAPGGNTNQAIGLQLGWTTLIGGGPFYSPPMDPNYKYTQVIILLTDGLNTQNRWSSTQSTIDARQQITCNNINAAKITLYTIQVNTGGDPTSTLLQHCAGSPGVYPDSSKFFLLTSSSQILQVFTQIGTELSQLRIAQ
jgi:Flp pilus assembly protein TadG